MTEFIVTPDAEAVVYSHLSAALSANVGTRVPNPRPTDPFVKVTQVGGQRRNLVAYSAMLTFECWAADDVAASDLCRLVYAHVWGMPGQMVGDVWVYKATDVSGVASFPDPETSSPRYQCTVQLDFRGKAI